jgi:hypothetical protein
MKKGYHGSLPVPSVGSHACYVQCCATLYALQGKGAADVGKFGK